MKVRVFGAFFFFISFMQGRNNNISKYFSPQFKTKKRTKVRTSQASKIVEKRTVESQFQIVVLIGFKAPN